MFGVVPKALWARLAEPDDRNRIALQTNCLLLRRLDTTTSDLVLIETGYGDKWDDKNRSIFALEQRSICDALREQSVAPADITHVIVSHLHFDHAGGLTYLDASGEPASTFPNARIITQQTEWNDALANKSTMTKTYLRSHLDPVASRVECIDGEHEVLPGITCWPVPGHTWGQQAIRFRDDQGTVAFIGDALPTINHAGPAFSMAYDMLPYQSMLTKRTLLEQAARERWRIVLDHEPGNPVVRVDEDDTQPGACALQVVE